MRGKGRGKSGYIVSLYCHHLPAMFPAVATAVDEAMLVTSVDDCNTFKPSERKRIG